MLNKVKLIYKDVLKNSTNCFKNKGFLQLFISGFKKTIIRDVSADAKLNFIPNFLALL